jgi:sRNA-binding protein
MATLTLSSGTAKIRHEAVLLRLGLKQDETKDRHADAIPANPRPLSADAKRMQARACELLLVVQARFPAAFSRLAVPLATNIHQQLESALAAEGYTPGDVGAMLRSWCNRPDYLTAIATGRMRVNLSGEPVGKPDKGHREYAANRLAELKARQKKTTGAIKQARRSRDCLHSSNRYSDRASRTAGQAA